MCVVVEIFVKYPGPRGNPLKQGDWYRYAFGAWCRYSTNIMMQYLLYLYSQCLQGARKARISTRVAGKRKIN